ncbi:hypothetical protein DVH24_016866 [Malus domestica]|uniref:Retrovirus-related Pol polyprotein from transposon TNT 1-94 n=1 Tax=Malus domestica TaxID=3750 RepID=A0A498IYA5_MALDO|nr:hypothetical protein DVH24_042261 [Malus domestica]RXI09805.1 hypothetical protein DVH24_016866 [Malus domestica]
MLMENFLSSNEYWSLVETWILGATEGMDLTDAQNKTIDNQKLKDMKPKNYMFQAIDQSILETVLKKDAARDIWDSLKQKYQGTALVKRPSNPDFSQPRSRILPAPSVRVFMHEGLGCPTVSIVGKLGAVDRDDDRSAGRHGVDVGHVVGGGDLGGEGVEEVGDGGGRVVEMREGAKGKVGEA